VTSTRHPPEIQDGGR